MDVGAPRHVFAADVKDIENYCNCCNMQLCSGTPPIQIQADPRPFVYTGFNAFLVEIFNFK